jgi:hypothetical protein
MTEPNGDSVEQVRAAGMLHSLSPLGTQPKLALAIGDALFAGGRLAALTECAVCGLLGDPGDECGRRPPYHVLVPKNGSPE